ncbi:MAG TPA: glycosyltransferase family 4 protein, partial [Pararhizobium sp.]|nr:glycosyltransferase family 4 protein [Pararhizobium sp.]
DEHVMNAIGSSDMETGEFVPCASAARPQERAAALVNAVRRGGFDAVFVNVLAEPVQMTAPLYLPSSVLRIAIVHNITPGTYAAARAIRGHVHATVGVSKRCGHDLVARHGFPRDRTVTIENAVDLAPFACLDRPPRRFSGLRMLYLGRIEDASKGVYWLPDIMRRLPEGVRLTIAGDGPELAALKLRFSEDDRVRFLGEVQRGRLPQLLARHDVLIMPSRYEGFGLTLVEAMAAGCLPVASHICGVTDNIVAHGADGFLFRVGDWREAARQIMVLLDEPALVRAMSARARRKAAAEFGIERLAGDYIRLIRRLQLQAPPIKEPLELEGWRLPQGLRPGLRTYLPRPVKNWLRVARERI